MFFLPPPASWTAWLPQRASGGLKGAQKQNHGETEAMRTTSGARQAACKLRAPVNHSKGQEKRPRPPGTNTAVLREATGATPAAERQQLSPATPHGGGGIVLRPSALASWVGPGGQRS